MATSGFDIKPPPIRIKMGDKVWIDWFRDLQYKLYNGLIDTVASGFQVTKLALLGYGTGAGGEVTQATDKSTTVTLNKPCGFIEMHTASLAAGASVEFQLNNTLIGTYSVMVVNVLGYTDYVASVVNVGGGTGRIRITNNGTTRSDGITLNFVVFSGSRV
jgi:hypothetical protein